MKKSSILEIAGGCALFSVIIGGILNCFILPIGYMIAHDCGKWICNHSYPMTWESYAIVTGIVFVLLFLIVFISEKATEGTPPPTRSCNQTYYRRTNQTSYRRSNQTSYRSSSNRTYSSSRETDYYDSDMEGAPGYNGFD